MNLCSDRHGEVCYEGRNCPACELVAQIATLNREKEELQSQVRKLDDALDQATSEKGE